MEISAALVKGYCLMLCVSTLVLETNTAPTGDLKQDLERFVELAKELDVNIQELEADMRTRQGLNAPPPGYSCKGTYCRFGGLTNEKEVDNTDQESAPSSIHSSDESTESERQEKERVKCTGTYCAFPGRQQEGDASNEINFTNDERRRVIQRLLDLLREQED